MNRDDALDDQWDRFQRARDLANKAHDEWLAYRDMEAGRPVIKASNPVPLPGQKLGRSDYAKLLQSGADYYAKRKAK